MTVQKNWIEKNMGITKKAIDTYEKHGLIHPAKNPNNGKYREFNENDLEQIWLSKFFVELGFSLVEIKDMISNSNFDFHKAIEEKIERMEIEKKQLEQKISLAKFIKTTGLFPGIPKEMGTIKFEDFLNNSCETLGIDTDLQSVIIYEMLQCAISKPDTEWSDDDIQSLFEKILAKPEAEWNDEDMLSIVDFFKNILGENTLESMFMLQSYWKELASLSHHEASHPEVQAVVKKMYDFEKKTLFYEHSDIMTPQWYAQSVPSFFTGSDIATLNEKNLGKANCEFIVKAIEYFGNHAE